MLKLTKDKHEASRRLSATAELLVVTYKTHLSPGDSEILSDTKHCTKSLKVIRNDTHK